MMIYDSRITEIGEDVEIFIEENMVVIFNESVPEDLKSIAIVHEMNEMTDDVTVGDYFVLGDSEYKILFVGDKANETLHELGHCTVKFGTPSANDLPGMIVVEEKKIEVPEIGDILKFYKQ